MKKKRIPLLIAFAILFTATFGQGTLCVALILGEVSKAFPDASVTQVQSIFTIIYYLMVVFVGASGLMTKVVNKKTLYVAGDFLIVAGGLIGYFVHNSLTWLYISGAMLGIGFGVMSSVVSALISENFDGDQRARMFGIQSVCVSLGGALLTALGGLVLKSLPWHTIYLFYLIYLPAGLTALFFLPSGPVEKANQGEKLSDSLKGLFTPQYIRCCIVVFLYAVVYLTFSSNISFFVDSDVAGFATTTNTLASMVAGLIIGSVFKKFKNLTPYLGLGIGTVSMIVPIFAQNNAGAIISGALLGFCNGIYSPSILSIIPDIVKPEHLTIAFSVWTLLLFLGQAMNTALVTTTAGLINDSITMRFVIAAVLLGLVTVINAAAVKKEETQAC